jgi:hypothetical protein
MSFLAPMFLIGGLAVGLPIVFHLIRRTSKDKIPFSSLMFLQPSPPRVTRRSRLENIWLLLLRCLVILLLALGFSRPFIQKPLAADPNSANGKRLVILLDTSASMRRDGVWAEARARAEETIRQAAPADKVSLITFDSAISTAWSFDDWVRLAPPDRVAMAKQRLQSLEPTWKSTHLGNALIQASEMLQDSKEAQTDNRKIVLISDLQKGSRLEGLQGHEWPTRLEVRLEPIKARKVTNAGLQLVAERDEAGDSDLKFRVTNAEDSGSEQFKVGWMKNNALLGAVVPAYVPPGQSRVFAAPKLGTNQIPEQLVLAGDNEEFDNTVFWVTPKAERIPLLYVGQDNAKNPEQSLYYLHRAFQQTARLAVQVVGWSPQAAAQPKEATTAKVAVLSEDASADQLRFVQEFLSQGHTVVFPLRSKAGAAVLSQLTGVSGMEAVEASGSGYSMLSQIDFEHPLFAPFADPRFNDFTKIHFWKHRKLDVGTLPKARVLARFENGDPALFQMSIGKGNLLVLTSGWYPSDSQLALSSKFVPLLYGILEQSGSIQLAKTSYTVGDDIPLPAASAKTPLSVEKPDGTKQEVVAGEKFKQATMPGIYKVLGVDPPYAFAVNIAADESKTAPMSVEELQKLGVPVRERNPAAEKLIEKQQLHLQGVELENRQKLWRWLIVTAIMVLIVETWLAGWLTRRAVLGAGT